MLSPIGLPSTFHAAVRRSRVGRRLTSIAVKD
jgi:hypothetical protein